jgi:prepilin-type N-terminal cleavage/methylation domain-containing protein
VVKEKIKTLYRGKICRGSLGNERGLSLLELLVVLIIIGLVAALSAPAFHRGWLNFQCKQAANRLASMMRFAHHRAILTKEPYIVRIDLDHQTIHVLKNPPTGPKTQGSQEDLHREPTHITFKLPPVVKIRIVDAQGLRMMYLGQRDIFFYPTGNSSGEAVELTNTMGTTYRVVVDPITGRASVTKEKI